MKASIRFCQTFVLIFLITGVYGQYCTPAYINGCEGEYGLIQFDLKTISRSIPCSGTPSYYHDYTDDTTDLAKNGYYLLYVQCEMPSPAPPPGSSPVTGTFSQGYMPFVLIGEDLYVSVWIDYDHDSTFSNTDEIVQQFICYESGVTYSFPVIISNLADMGYTRLRIMSSTNGYPSDPCADPGYGNACDFTVNIVEPVAPPDVTTLDATDVSGWQAVLNGAVNANGSPTYTEFHYGLDTTYGETVSGDPDLVTGSDDTPVSAFISGLLPDTTYHFKLVGYGEGGYVSGNDSTFHTLDEYCLPYYSDGCSYGDGITYFELNTISQEVPCSGSPSYIHDYTSSDTTDLCKGGYYFASVQVGYSETYIKIWIDYNHNTVFDSTELVGQGIGWTTEETFLIPVSIPDNALTGNTVLRVITNWLSFPSGPCDSYEYGNCCDFTVNITAGGTAPTISTDSAGNVIHVSAILYGTVNANGAAVNTSFEYGTDTTYGSFVPGDPFNVSGSTDTSFSAWLTDLLPDTTYHFRAVATGCGGKITGDDMTFITGTLPPTVYTNSATLISGISATLNGYVNPNGVPAAVTFQYGATTDYGITVPAVPDSVSGSVFTNVSAALTGLSLATTYHFRVVAITATDTSYGADYSFTTLATQYCIPAYSTGCNTHNMGLTSFQLNSINQTITCTGTPNYYHDFTSTSTDLGINGVYSVSVIAGYMSNYVRLWIDYNQNNVFESNEKVGEIICSSSGNTYTGTITISGSAMTGPTRLRAMTEYGYYPSNPCGSYTYGNCSDFTVNIVPNGPPLVATNPATSVSGISAVLNGLVNPNGYSSTVSFEYGLTASYGTTVAGSPSPLTGYANTAVSVPISGLSMNTTYHYRVFSTNSEGTTYGADMTFTTWSTLYCIPFYSVGCGTFGLSYFGLNTIAQTISCSGTPSYYHDYTSLSTDVVPGGNYSISVNTIYGNSLDAKVWIDYNQNNAFDGTSEVAGQAYISSTYYPIPVTISASAFPGPTRLRIMVRNSNSGYPTDPCSQTEVYGNAADFTVNILPPGPPIVTTQAATSVGGAVATLNGTVNPNNLSTSVTFDYGLTNTYELGSIAGSPSPLTGGSFYAVTGSLTGLSSGTIYHYRVHAENSTGTTTGVDMTFTTLSATTTQVSTSQVYLGSVNQQIIKVSVINPGTSVSAPITGFTFNTNGCTDIADISKARLYYTGTNNSFSTSTSYGSEVTGFGTLGSSFFFSGSQTISAGTNYFWLVYDISPTGTPGNIVDAECTAVTCGADIAPTVTAPAGYRQISGDKYLISVTGSHPSTTPVSKGSENNEILMLDFWVAGTTGTLPLTYLQTYYTGTATGDIAANGVKLFITSTPVFATTTQLGSSVSFSGSYATFSGLSYDLPTGHTYVWLTFNITGEACGCDITDARINSGAITVSGLTYPASVQDPAGSRQIAPSLYTVPFMESAWTKVPPCDWNKVGSYWNKNNGASAGGTAPEAYLSGYNIPVNDKLITPPVNATGLPYLVLNFKTYMYTYFSGTTFKVQSSSDGINWTDEAWSWSSPASNWAYSGPYNISTTITSNIGSATYIAFTMTAQNYYCAWYIDNVEIVAPQPPSVTTAVTTSSEECTAVSGGTVTDNPANTVNARGVCWSASMNPTLSDPHTTDGAGTGTFVSNITGLNAATTYHVRAYATNNYGTGYGNDVLFTTYSPGITGNPGVCVGSTTILSCSTSGGIWSSGSTGVATIDPASGLVTGISAGQSVITYAYTNASSCACSIVTTVTVFDTPASPDTVTAMPPEICGTGISNLNAVSPGNMIYWYTVPTGGTPIGNSPSGENFPVSPVSTTTYYAESNIQTGNQSQTFIYTGAPQLFTVPAGVYYLTIDCYGAEGIGKNGYTPGQGGRSRGEMSVVPGQTLNIYVGGQNLFNGGGSGKGGANGGDGTDVRVGGIALSDRIIVAGGGGGAGGDNWGCNSGNGDGGGGIAGSNYVGGGGGSGYSFCGGNGGSTGGTSGSATHGGGGGGGGLTSGGAGANATGSSAASPGSFGFGGASNNSAGCGATGGGGGGYYGGGGAAGTNCGAGQGGGGSSWTGTLYNPYFQAGVQNGNGKVIISWSVSNPNCALEPRSPVTVILSPPTVGGTISPSDTTVCPGTNSIVLTLTGNTGAIQWQSSPDNIAFTNIEGATTSVYTAVDLTTTTYYRAAITSGSCVPAYSDTAVITVPQNATLTLTSAPGTDDQVVCANSPITDITYSAGGGATGAVVTGLPEGVTGAYSAGVVTISGTPTADGTFNYTVTTTGLCPPQASANGTILVNPVYPVSISISANKNDTCAGTQVTYTATPVNPGLAINATVGTGTVSCHYPFTTYWEGGRTQLLYTAAQLTSGGLVPGSIQSIGFNIVSYSSQPMQNFNINMMNTTATTLTAWVTGMQNCYSGTYAVPGTGWRMINLTTPFYWNGQNMIIEICYGDNGYWTSYSYVYGTTAPAGQIRPYYTDNIVGCSYTGSPGTGNTGLPNLKFISQPNYQWSVNGVNVGTNSTTYSYIPANDDSVKCVLTSTYPCTSGNPATSNTITMNVLPPAVPTITGPASVCEDSTGNVYITESGYSDYLWNVSAGGTITAGGTLTDNTATVTWSGSGIQTISVNYSVPSGCNAVTPTVKEVTVHPSPVPAISGSESICGIPSAGNVYTTETGMTDYSWTVSPGGTITAGGSPADNSITVTWTETGVQTISVNYKNANGCRASGATVLNVSVDLVPEVIVSGDDTTCQGTMVTYTTTVTNGGSNPTYQWFVNGLPAPPSLCQGDVLSGILSYYPFNGNANDEGPNGNNGTVYGAILTTNRFGIANAAYDFNGSGNYIEASSNNLPAGNRTVSVWFKVNSIANMPNILGYGGNSCGQSFLMTINYCGSASRYYIHGHCDANGIYTPINPISLTTWNHLVATVDGSLEKVYINGSLAANGNNFTTPTYVASKELGVGTAISTSGYAPYTSGCMGWFNGQIDDISIYNRVLSASEVSYIYHNRGPSFCYIPADGDVVTCEVMTGNGCTATSNSIDMTVLPAPSPTLSGPAIVCQNSIGNVYTTESGKSDYQWNVSAGGTITSGGTAADDSVTVTWTGSGAQTVSVNYSLSNNCSAASPAVLNVAVYEFQLPTLTGPSSICGIPSAGNVYITEAGKTGYAWSVSAGGTITGGGSSTDNTITVTWTAGGNQTVGVSYTDVNNCAPPAPTVKNIYVHTPVVTIAGDSTICAGDTIEFIASTINVGPNANYQWFVNGVPVVGTMCGGGLWNGLLAYYPLNGNANDSSGNGRNGTMYGSPALTTNRYDEPGQAYYFDGADDYVYLGSWFNYNKFSISFWVNQAGFTGNYTDIIDNNHTDYRNWVIQSTPNNLTYNFGIAYVGGVNFTLTTNQWRHIVCIKDSLTMKSYIDGSLQQSIPCSYAPSYNSPHLYISRWGGGTRYFKGKIDDVRFYNRALCESEIQTLYTGHDSIFRYVPEDGDTLYCVVTTTVGCSDTSNTIGMSVLPALVPTITGPDLICGVPSTDNVYTTEYGKANYSWSVSAGGTIMSGAGTESITVTWNTPGAKTVTVNYENSNGCSAASPTVKNVGVFALPVPTISGPGLICGLPSTGTEYTTEPGMMGYFWTVSPGGTIAAGQGTNVITINWLSYGEHTVIVSYEDANGCETAVPASKSVHIYNVPVPTLNGPDTIYGIPSPGNTYTTESGMNNYVWNVTSGGIITSGGSSAHSYVTVTWNALGAQTVSVNYTDINGCTAPLPAVQNVEVIFANHAPVANAGLDQSTLYGQLVTLNGSGSYDIDNDSLSFSWTAPAGITLSDSTAIHPTFTPPISCVIQTYICSLVVNDGQVNSQPDYVSITVSAAQPDIAVIPASYTVTIPSGNSLTEILRVKNEAYCNLTINLTTLASWIVLIPNSDVIPGGDSIDITIHFSAAGLYAGTYNSTIRISSNDPDEPIVNIPVTLIVTGEPDIVVSPVSLDFGTIYTGQTLNRTLTVTNAGTANLSVTGIVSNLPEYTVNISNFTLTPTLSKNVTVTFTPISGGTFNGVLTITSNDPDQPTVAVSLTGQALVPPDISVSPLSLRDSLLRNQISLKHLVIENRGGMELVFTVSESVSWLSLWPVAGTIDPGKDTTVDVLFNSSGKNPGVYSATIKINSNDPFNPLVTIPVSLTVLAPLAVQATATPSPICAGSSTQLNAIPSGGYGNYTYLWSSDPPGFSSILKNPVASPVITTTYHVTVSDGHGTANSSVTVPVYLNQPPGMISNMVPADSAFDLQLPLVFSWTPAFNASVYDIYIWRYNQPQPVNPIASNLTQIQYTLPSNGPFSYGDTCKWRVVAKNPCYQTPGPVQLFSLKGLPELHVTGITNSEPVAGQPMTISWTVKNDGEGETPVGTIWYDRVWLSADLEVRVGEWEDILLAQYPNVSYLDIGESYVQTQQIVMPQNIMGTYFIFVITDNLDATVPNYPPGGPPIPYDPPPYYFAGSHGGAYVNTVREISDNGAWSDNFFYKQITFPVPPVPDLQVTSIIGPDDVFSGQPCNITWTVTNLGDGNTSVNTWSDRIYFSPDTILNPATAINLGTFSHTGILNPDSSYTQTKSVTIPANVYGIWYFFITTDINNNVFEYLYEGNNTSRSDTVNVFLTPPPDLVVTGIEAPDSISNWDHITLTWTVKNQGASAPTVTNWYDGVYLSQSPDYDLTGAIYLGNYQRTSTLLPGDTYTAEKTFFLSASITGPYYIYVYTDMYNNVFEYMNENNNKLRSDTSVIVINPDLVVSGVTVPAVNNNGQPFGVQWTDKNNGPGKTYHHNWVDRIYASESPVYHSDSVVQIGDDYNANITLLSGQTLSNSKTVTLPDTMSGNCYIYVWTDILNSVYENGMENNNLSGGSGPIHVLKPDLVAGNVTVPAVDSTGAPVEITWKVTNEGEGTVLNRTWTDQILISYTPVYNPASVIPLSTINYTGNLTPGASITKVTSVTLPDTIPGPYYIFVHVDYTDVIYENGSEENNISRSPDPVEIKMPDLIISNLSGPPAASSGSEVDFTWLTKNTGPAWIINKSWTDRVFISQQAVYIPAASVCLGDLINSGTLPPGDGFNNQLTVTIPDGIQGNYFIHVYTDFTNQIKENMYESNNVSTIPIQVVQGPWADLRVTSIIVPGSSVAGSTIPIDFSVMNDGTKGIYNKSWKDKVYLSNLPVWNSTSATLLREFSQSDDLEPDSSYDVGSEVNLPSGLATGTYYIYVFTDANNNIYENTGENNNILRSSGITITALPPVDLIAENVSSPDSASSGQSITVQWSVRNIGTSPTVNSWLDGIYLSPDSIWSKTTDIFVAQRMHYGILNPDDHYETSQICNLPNGIEGDYYLLAVADHNLVNNDQNPVNNAHARVNVTNEMQTIHISLTPPPDLIIPSFIVPTQALTGTPFNVSWTVKNTGIGVTIPDQWTDRIYLSTDFTINSGDILIGAKDHTGDLDVNESYTESLQVTIPNNVSGNYIVIIKTDYNDLVYESDENNNTNNSFIVVTQPPPADLIVTSISFPGTVIVGENATIQWTLHNAGQNPAVGSVKDLIYFSDDQTWDINDVLFGSYSSYINLPANAEVARSLEAKVKDLHLGEYHVIVRTDILNGVYEDFEENNTSVSAETFFADVTVLPLNIVRNDTLYDFENLYFRIPVADSLSTETMLATLKADSITGMNEMYLSHNSMPTRINYEYSGGNPYQGNQEIIVPSVSSGNYYMMLYGNTLSGNSQEISLLAEILEFEIISVTPDEAGNTGPVTLLIRGSNFNTGVGFKLHGSRIIEANDVLFVDRTKMYATFDLTGAETGVYDVIADNQCADKDTLFQAFEIKDGTIPSLGIYAITPNNVRANRVTSFTIEYTNLGNIDLINPAIEVRSLAGAPIALNVEGLAQNDHELTLTLTEENGPPGILRPGYIGSVVIYTKSTGPLGFTIVILNQ